MIAEALHHLRGIGPTRLAKLHAGGVRSWTDVVTHADRLPTKLCDEMLAECRRCLAALEINDVRYFVERFAPRDKWRILSHFIEQTTFFDIETEGLDCDARVTVIGCWHRGQLRTFVEHENLDAFLELLDEVTLLASFNGASFDVPRILNAFHIPELPCPHLDLRWMCHHHGWKGGLKDITAGLGITRPADLANADGSLAIQLWNMWIYTKDYTAREQLLRYCGADVLLIVMLAHRLTGLEHSGIDHCGVDYSGLNQLWSHLLELSNDHSISQRDEVQDTPALSASVGLGSPSRLRALRFRFAG